MYMKKIDVYITRIMKIVILLLFIGIGTAYSETYSQTTLLSLNVKKQTIREVLNTIEKESEYVFFFSDEINRELDKKIDIRIKNQTLNRILDQILDASSVSYTIIDRQVVLQKNRTPEPPAVESDAEQQDGIRIAGTVTDANGEPVIGANVLEKGTTNGNITDVNGNFSLTVESGNAVLQISYIGYISQDVRVNNRTSLRITLNEDLQSLDEVVVVAYGTQKKASLTGSVATIGGDQLQSIPTSNLTNALAGRLSGVTVSQTQGGRPGNSSSLTIRARGTWNSTDPLYVIDGIVRDSRAFDVLDASEVENISILKDASAASIYGSRAANGVILVQTRRGKEGSKPLVSYSGSVGVGSFTLRPARETAMQHIAFTNNYEREYNINPNTDNNIPLNSQWGFRYWPNTYKNGTDPSEGYINGAVFSDDEIEYYRTHEYDLLKEAWQAPISNNHAINISGGNNHITYFAGVTYYNESGAFKSLNYDKYTIRGGLDAQILPGLKLSATINTDNSVDTGPNISEHIFGSDSDAGGRKLGSLFYELVKSSPIFPGKVDGKYIGTGSGMTGDNALALADGVRGTISDKYWNTEYTAALQYDLPWVKGLTAKVMYNKYVRQRYYKRDSQSYLVYQLEKAGANNHILTDNIVSSVEKGGKPALYENHATDDYYQLNGFINYNNTFGKHEVGAMVGFEQAESGGEWFEAEKTNYDLANKPYFNYGPTDKQFYSINGKGWEDARLSYIGRLNYGFDSRYLLEFSFRRDASVKFDQSRRWGFFPAGSAAWRIAEEGFFKERLGHLVNNLKLRGSVGLTGNDAVGAWQYMDLAQVATGGAYYGGSSYTYGTSIGRVANPLITWEKSLSYNAGLDAGLFNNMITFGFEYFFRHTYDILGSQTNEIPDTFGATLADSNYGIVDSWGYDLEVGFNKQVSKAVSVWAKANFGFADNKLVEWAETGVPEHLSKIGKNWDRQYGYVADDIVRSAVNNGDGTYTINGRYVVPEEGYLYRGSNYNINSSNKYAMRPGSVFIKDIGSSPGVDENGDKIYSTTPDGIVTEDDADKTWIIDRYNPPYNFGLLLGASWKGFSLETFIQGLLGHQTYIATANAAQYDWTASNWEFWSGDHFSFEGNPDGNMPAPTNMGGHNMQGDGVKDMTTNHSFWVRDASFVRLKNITLSYDVNRQLLSKARISLAKIYLTANNVALLYNPLKIFDPELAGTTNDPTPNQNKPGSGIYSYPLMRTVTLGVNFNF
jgi:TonB-linked SusC/RagA family outer membrane protein